MQKRLKSLFWFAVDNGPTILTIGFASYVIALAQTSKIPTDTVLQWVLAILGLLAVSELTERLRRIRRIEENTTRTLQAIENKFGERVSADQFFIKKLPPLDSYLERASSVYLSGVTLQRMIRENIHILSQLLQDGASIRVIIVDPESRAIEQVSSAGVSYSVDILRANAQSTIANLARLSTLPNSKGRIELRYIDEQPHFNTIAIDPNKNTGIMFIEMTSQRWLNRGRPRFELTSRRDQHWFNYFKTQYEKVWEDARTVTLGE